MQPCGHLDSQTSQDVFPFSLLCLSLRPDPARTWRAAKLVTDCAAAAERILRRRERTEKKRTSRTKIDPHLSVASRQTEVCLCTRHRGQTDTAGSHSTGQKKEKKKKASVALWKKCQSQKQSAHLWERLTDIPHSLMVFKCHTHQQRQNDFLCVVSVFL